MGTTSSQGVDDYGAGCVEFSVDDLSKSFATRLMPEFH
jgi:hypothetical protein